MFPTPTFVPLKECSGVRLVTSPAENKNKKGLMNPNGPCGCWKQKNLKAKAALRIFNYQISVGLIPPVLQCVVHVE